VNAGRIVAVTGATGRQGGAVTRHLLADGWQVRALTRSPLGKPARRLAALGAQVVQADMTEPRALDAAFAGAYGVYSVQNPMIDGVAAEITQGKNVADAAERAGVRHLVYGSAGVGVPGTGIRSWESKLVVQAHLEKLGLPLTVLRPTAFMELMTDRGFHPAVAVWNLMPKLMGEDRTVWWLAVDDLGAVAARAFADPGRFLGAELQLSADGRSVAECRELWREVMGRPPRRFPMPVRLFERFGGADLTTMWRWLATAELDSGVDTTREILPRARTVREWLVQNSSGSSA